MMDVSVNHLLLQIESNSFMLSTIRFCTVSPSYTLSCLLHFMKRTLILIVLFTKYGSLECLLIF